MKKEKSKQLFAYLVLDKNESRDKNISEILGEKHTPILNNDSLLYLVMYTEYIEV